MCVVNKQFDLLKFVFDSVYMGGCLGTLCRCGGCSECDACTVICVACVYTKSVRVTAMLAWVGERGGVLW